MRYVVEPLRIGRQLVGQHGLQALLVAIGDGCVTAAAWLLERKYPDEYAQTTRKAEDASEDAPQIVLGVTVQAVKGGGDA